jgi:hypothetical protein
MLLQTKNVDFDNYRQSQNATAPVQINKQIHEHMYAHTCAQHTE